MQRDEAISPRSSASLRLRQSASRVALLRETREECFGQGRCRLSPHLNTDRQKVLSFLQARPSTAQGLLAEPAFSSLLLSYTLLPGVSSKYTHGDPRHRTTVLPSGHGSRGALRTRVSQVRKGTRSHD